LGQFVLAIVILIAVDVGLAIWPRSAVIGAFRMVSVV
jgi:hypothetical protein